MKLDKLSLKDKRHTIYEEIPINKLGEKLHAMTTRKDTATRASQPDLSRVIKENESRKRKATSRASEMPKKFIALAEHTLHFQKDTPPRFHSSRRRSSGMLIFHLCHYQSYITTSHLSILFHYW